MIDLHGMEMSPGTRKVRWALEERGIAYTPIEVSVPKGETRTEAFRRINPLGTIPTIVDRRSEPPTTMCESNAIVVYLMDLPPDPRQRARTLQWVFWEPSLFDPLHRALLMKMGILPSDGYSAAIEATTVRLAQLETAVDELEGFSAADIVLGGAIAQARGAELDLAPYPRIRAWFEQLAKRPAFQRAHPELAR